MDERLQQRLDLYRAMPDTPDGVVDAVARELELLEPDHQVDDETAGMLTSHLIAALGRTMRHEPEIDPPSPEMYEEVLTQAPDAVERAADVASRIEAALGVSLPGVEQQYLAFHLAALALRTAGTD